VSALLDLREDQWDAATNLNLKWTFFACQAAARSMSQGPAPDGGTITLSSQRLAA
jgi:NAD(P)-dependent dehydrogenase (short-subunit alcohol dehydrogenase family)